MKSAELMQLSVGAKVWRRRSGGVLGKLRNETGVIVRAPKMYRRYGEDYAQALIRWPTGSKPRLEPACLLTPGEAPPLVRPFEMSSELKRRAWQLAVAWVEAGAAEHEPTHDLSELEDAHIRAYIKEKILKLLQHNAEQKRGRRA